MTTYTFTDLQLRVTLAPWRKAQMPQWDDAEWRIHLHHECVLYLNGNGTARVFGATIEDLADRGMTGWDRAGTNGFMVGVIEPTQTANKHLAETNKELAKRAEKMAELPASLAAPADPYEPVGTMPVVGDKVVQRHWNEPLQVTCVGHNPNGVVVDADGCPLHKMWIPQRRFLSGDAIILKRQAAPAPAAAGLQVWRHNTDQDILYLVKGDSVWARQQGLPKWDRCTWKWDALQASCCTRLPEPEEAREIAAAREAGVL